MANRLAEESSPYLLQHSHNPVDWYPWGDEAFERARADDKPIFLSIGYSSCHWCHVMERESFTDQETAAYLNENFVSIKVDREERPDLDHIYMQAVTSLTGRGGWPLSVWLTGAGEPFYGGTYFPPQPRFGMASFRQVLEAVLNAWKHRRSELEQAALGIHDHLAAEMTAWSGLPGATPSLPKVLDTLLGDIDPIHGGWGDAPKFPQPLAIDFVLAAQAVSLVRSMPPGIGRTLDAMAAGGMYDHLGGGFHRYATDEAWLVPHFEKMLYDNAQLARCYLHAWQLTGKPHYRAVTEETLSYLLRRMSHSEGGFFSAEDADSEGREGAFYTWTLTEIRECLPSAEAQLFAAAYGVTTSGNFEGTNVLHLVDGDAAQAEGDALQRARTALLEVRRRRAHPARDEKVLAGWNGLALAAIAEAASAFQSDHYRHAAIRTGEFLTRELVRDGNCLVHSWTDGRMSGNAFLEDYACVVDGLLALYQATFAEPVFVTARRLTDVMMTHFRKEDGGFYDTSSEHEGLIVRPRSVQDSPTPCGSSMAATVLLKMAAFTGESRYWDAAEETLMEVTTLLSRAPMMFGQWLLAALMLESGLTEVAIVGELDGVKARSLLDEVRSKYRPVVVAGARGSSLDSVVPILAGREPQPGTTAQAWTCSRETCSPPIDEPAVLRNLLVRT